MLPAAPAPHLHQSQSIARPVPGFHLENEAFAQALAVQKQMHARAAAAEAARISTLQSRRENVLHARSILNAICDSAFRQTESTEAARCALFLCIDRAVHEIESILGKSAAQRYNSQ